MARIRSTHPEQWTDDQFVTCSPLARLLALALRNEADDNGVFEWNPVKLKMRLLPADNADINELLAELVGSNQVKRFEHGGKPYGVIRSFTKFQRPKSPTFSHPYPASEQGQGYEPNKGYSGVVPNDSGSDGEEQGESERRGGEGRSSGEDGEGSSRKRALPKNFRLSDEAREYATERALDIPAELEKFRDHHSAKGSKFADWDAAWRTWCRNAVKFREKDRPRGELGRLE